MRDFLRIYCILTIGLSGPVTHHQQNFDLVTGFMLLTVMIGDDSKMTGLLELDS